MPTKTLPGRSRRSKAEIQSEFNQIRETAVEERSERTAKEEELARVREKEIQEVTQGITPENIVQRLGTMELEISKTISGFSVQLLAESKLLQQLREAVSLEKTELEQLHKIDVAQTALDQLFQDYEEAKSLQEKEMSEVRAAWAAEQQEQDKELKLYEDELKRQRQREKEAFEYERNQERKLEQASYSESLRDQQRENQEKQEALEKTWAAREAVLKEREDELARLRMETAAFPERLKKETDRAVAEVAKTLQTEHKQIFALAQKDSEAEKRLAEVRIRSLEDAVARQSQEILNLTQRLEESKRQVQEIALKAIDGASGARALAHINQIAMEQAKTRSTTD